MSDAAIIPYCKEKDKPNSGSGEARLWTQWRKQCSEVMSSVTVMIWQCMDQIEAILRQQYRQVAKSGVQ